jgi:hypothetical protein
MKKKPILSDKPPSHEFLSVVRGGGGPSIDCSMCGRVHYSIDSPYYEEGELASYQELRAEDPDGYIETEGECVHYSAIQGQTVPDGCPCNGLRKYEDFMWSHRDLWCSYLMARKLSAQKEADSIFIPNI